MQIDVDFTTALLAGYPVMATVISVLFNKLNKVTAEYINHLSTSKTSNYSRVSDIENRLAEIEHADD